MAQWNLSVDLRGSGNGLARTLQANARHARTLASAVRDAQSEIRTLDTASRTAQQNLNRMGGAATSTQRRLTLMASQARNAAKELRDLARAAEQADARLRAAARDVQIKVQVDDDTAPGAAAVRASMARLEALSPVNLGVQVDDNTAAGAAAVRASVARLNDLGPVRLGVLMDDDTAAGVTAARTSVARLGALGPVNVGVQVDDETGPGAAEVRASIARLEALNPVRLGVQVDDDTAAGEAAVRASMARVRALGGPVRLDVQVDDQTATGAAAVRAEIARIAALSPVRLDVRVDTNLAQVTTAFNTVQGSVRDTSRALMMLRGRALSLADALDRIRDSALLAAGGLTLLGGAAHRAGSQLNALRGHMRDLRTDLDDLDTSLTRTITRVGDLRTTTGSLGSSTNSAAQGTNSLMLGAVALATALIPVAASVAPIAAGLTAAGVAIGAFGGAVAGQIVALTESAEAEEKYQKAVREHGATSAEAATAEKEYLRTVHEMPAATRQAAAGLSVLKDGYKDWSNALADDTMPVVTKSMSLFGTLLPRLTPLVKGTSKELDRLLNVAAGGMSTPGFDRFVTSFTRFANESLARGTTGIIKFTQALDTGQIGDSLREFLDYARANGPLVADTLGNLAQAAMHLLVAASDMGVSVLTAVNALAQLVNAVPAPALSAFLQLYAVLKLVSVGIALVGTAAGGAAAANLAAFVRSARFGGVGPAISGVVQRMSALQKAAVGLGVLGLVAIGIDKLADKARGAPPNVDRLTTSLKELAVTGKMTGELEDTFGGVEGLIDSMKKYQVEVGKAAKASEGPLGFRIPGVSDLSDWFGDKANDLSQGEDSLNALKEDFEGVDDALAQMVASGNSKEAATGFDLISRAGKKAGLSTKELSDLFPDYKDALADLKAEQQLTAAGMGIFGQQALATKQKLDAQKASTDGLRQSIVALNDVNRAALGGMIGFEAGIDAAAKAAKENAGSLRMVNGELDLNSPKAQEAANALTDLGAKTDAAATAARDSGKSWEYVNGIYARGRTALIDTARQMGLTKAQAEQLAKSILDVPATKKTQIEMDREDAINGLDAVIKKIQATPGKKSVTVNALTQSAIAMLETLGYRTKTLPDGRVQVTAVTGPALAGLGAVKAARDGLRDKSISISVTTTYRKRTVYDKDASGVPDYVQAPQARGSVLSFYADGGMNSRGVRENHIAQIAPAGAYRVWGERETGGEAYVPLAPSKRPRSRSIAEETVRRLGGDPAAIQWNAQGSVTAFASGGFTYAPTGTRRSTSDVQSAYSNAHQPITKDDYLKKVRAQQNAVDTLRTAEAKLKEVRKGKHTHAQLVAAENQVAKARRSVSTATEAARKAEARYKKTFSLADWQKTLKTAVSANASWEANLNKIAARGGGDVIDQLRDMGEEGAAVVAALAKASKKQFADIVANLKKLGPLAKASLDDYTKQLNASTKTDSTFQANLTKLAGMGYGDLAAQLAAQGDDTAKKLAADAVKSKSKAGAANTAAKKAGAQLSSDELSQLIQIIAAVKTSKTGIHDVAGSTGLGEGEIIATATKASAQIKSSLGSRATKFLADLGKANKGLAYANGGIRPGIYSTAAGAVTFAEPSTGGEAYIPLGASKRGRATDVLRDVAGRFGVGLTDASGGGGRVVIVREQGPLIGSQTWQITSGGNATDTARRIDADNGYQLRRLARGGVAAR
ncbi:hypothetical protein [Streptomyces sp. NPDC047939]|uniref:hypothetical protein n=1 Tax=Streptomyces sp. NPDC047939 TaxID=3155381 RepID=UPI003446C440